MSCVSTTAEAFLDRGLIIEAEKDATVSEAAKESPTRQSITTRRHGKHAQKAIKHASKD